MVDMMRRSHAKNSDDFENNLSILVIIEKMNEARAEAAANGVDVLDTTKSCELCKYLEEITGMNQENALTIAQLLFDGIDPARFAKKDNRM